MTLAKAVLVRGMSLTLKESESRIANGEIEVNGEVCTDAISDVSDEDEITYFLCTSTSYDDYMRCIETLM